MIAELILLIGSLSHKKEIPVVKNIGHDGVSLAQIQTCVWPRCSKETAITKLLLDVQMSKQSEDFKMGKLPFSLN